MAHEPKTLQEAIIYFADQDNCIEYFAEKRWPFGVVCPHCGSDKAGYLKKQRRWQCSQRHPKRQFSVKVGTIFEDSPLGLDKWLPCIWLVANCKNGISSYEVHRGLGVTQKTAWFMLHRVRLMLQGETEGKLSGEVEVDETFIGGKARNMHVSKRKRRITGTGGRDKAVVFGMVERGGQIRTQVVTSNTKPILQGHVRENVEAGAALFSDALLSYVGLERDYAHGVIDHAVAYVDGAVHTNTLENFWSLLKRGINGTYISVEPFHLFRYLDEQAFRYNNRKDMTDSDRFQLAMAQAAGKRLTYAEVTGKGGETTLH